MSFPNPTKTLLATHLALFGAMLLIAGCAKKDETAAAASGGSADSASGGAALAASGKSVFDANGCSKCHAIGGQGGRMGPDLSRIGAKSGVTPESLVAFVKNPKAQKPSSRMPAFEGRISEKDLAALGAYLAGLK